MTGNVAVNVGPTSKTPLAQQQHNWLRQRWANRWLMVGKWLACYLEGCLANIICNHRHFYTTNATDAELRHLVIESRWPAATASGSGPLALTLTLSLTLRSQTQCQLYDYRTTTFHLRRVHRIGVQKASQSLRFVNINLLPCHCQA